MGEFKDKADWIKESYKNSFANGNFSWFRIYRFFFSKKGQKRIFRFFAKLFGYVFRKLTGRKDAFMRDYNLWQKQNALTPNLIDQFEKEVQTLAFQPKISVLVPVYNPPIEFLKSAVESVRNQIYPHWELCLADDKSTNVEVIQYLESLQGEDKIKVNFRAENGHISAATNTALADATGEYVALLDQDDLLTPDALFKNVKVLNKDQTVDLIYSDEDKINEKGQRTDPHFKPDWCPDNFLSRNYLCHLLLLRKDILDQINGFRIGFEGSQDYDLLLRYTEHCKNIYHIPEVLYHWRMHDASTASNEEAKPYAFQSGVKALEEALDRRGVKGKVALVGNLPGFYSIRYEIEKPGKVSIIIPSKNLADVTNVAIESVFKLTDYPDFEVILISNNSDEQSFFDLAKKWKEKEPERFVFIEDNGSFNFSRLMNTGAKVATGEYFLLLNNDTEIIHADWMTAMVEQAQRESVGAVGVKLLYPNEAVQHAGVVIGLGGVAGHPFVNHKRTDSGYFCNLKSISNYSAVTAACLMVRRSVFEEVKGFDEGLAVEFNDVDFCLRVKELGLNNVYLPHVELFHYESISRGHPYKTRKSYNQSMKEVQFFSERWDEYIKNDPCYNPNLSLIFNDFRLRVKDA